MMSVVEQALSLGTLIISHGNHTKKYEKLEGGEVQLKDKKHNADFCWNV
jgi:hypothetical protein